MSLKCSTLHTSSTSTTEIMTTNQRHRTVFYFRKGRGFRPWLIRLLTRSDVSHVAVGYGDAVYEVNYRLGGIYWTRKEYLSLPDPCIGIGVESDRHPCLDGFVGSPRPNLFRVALKVATRGRSAYGHDCVDIAKCILITLGAQPPRTITTPGALMDWLMEMMINDWIETGQAASTLFADAQR